MVWRLAERQHDLVTYRQLIELGMTPAAIRHRVSTGRLHRVGNGVFSLTRLNRRDEQRWMAAVLAAGEPVGASHGAALALWRFGNERFSRPEISVEARRNPRPNGVIVHRRKLWLPGEMTRHRLIPVTSPALTIVDNAVHLGPRGVDEVVSKADGLDRVHPDEVRALAERHPTLPGSPLVKTVVDRHTFRLTESELERMVLRLLRRAGLPLPDTQVRTGAGRVDFIWNGLGLIVEADSLRYHRTTHRQAADARRDAQHALRGMRTLRFTHWDVVNDPGYVTETVRKMIVTLRG